MAKETETRMNIVSINRVDPYVKNIVDSSAHVAFYTFNADTSGETHHNFLSLIKFSCTTHFNYRMGENRYRRCAFHLQPKCRTISQHFHKQPFKHELAGGTDNWTN